MSENPQDPKSPRPLNASARLNAWAIETLAAITSESPDRNQLPRLEATDDGNTNLAWSATFVVPMTFSIGVAIAASDAWRYLFWGLAVIFAIISFVNLTQCLWIKRRRAALEAEINRKILEAVKEQKCVNDELINRVKALEYLLRSPRPYSSGEMPRAQQEQQSPLVDFDFPPADLQVPPTERPSAPDDRLGSPQDGDY